MRFANFVRAMEALLDRQSFEEAVLPAQRLMAARVARDDRLLDAFAAPESDHLTQYMLPSDPQGRFSVLSVVWGPGHAAGPHDHTI